LRGLLFGKKGRVRSRGLPLRDIAQFPPSLVPTFDALDPVSNAVAIVLFTAVHRVGPQQDSFGNHDGRLHSIHVDGFSKNDTHPAVGDIEGLAEDLMLVPPAHPTGQRDPAPWIQPL